MQASRSPSSPNPHLPTFASSSPSFDGWLWKIKGFVFDIASHRKQTMPFVQSKRAKQAATKLGARGTMSPDRVWGRAPQKKAGNQAACPFPAFAYFISSSAIASICAVLSALSAAFIVTVVSSHVMFFDFSNFAFITLAAVGAHVPFSMIPIVRF